MYYIVLFNCFLQQRKYNSIELAISEPYHGCTQLLNTHLVKGRIVLIQRG